MCVVAISKKGGRMKARKQESRKRSKGELRCDNRMRNLLFSNVVLDCYESDIFIYLDYYYYYYCVHVIREEVQNRI